MISLWSLYNTVEKIQIDDLKTEQVKIVLLSIPTSRMKDWVVLKKGTVNWQPLAVHPEFYDDVNDLRGQVELNVPADPTKISQENKKPAPPDRRPLFEDVDLDAEQTLSIMDAGNYSVKERRSARRQNRSLKFEVIHGGKHFETETKDISMSGMSLKDPLPEWLTKEFPAKLHLGNQVIDIRAIRARKGKSDTALVIVEANPWALLRTWVVGW
ncbi:MAG TPA: hypothetical protein DCL41_05020 [Bdellovibrionales bacterium]|nr:hypothetical protein [Pseudobdellovibrionaceae bacterium]HAG91208.1 hypothetical protein [Bdellovibrionales bacterium]|tara:strand:+ start:1004 stop:1642 length:639 start_codon:yes stop_codon:yes gene_type:complete